MARKSFTGGVRATCASFLSDLSSSAGFSSNESEASAIASAARSAVPSVFEALEARRLLSSIMLSSGVLKITGDSSPNELSVATSGSNLVAKTNSLSKSYSTSSVSRIEIIGGDSADKITVASNVYKNAKIDGRGGNDILAGGSGRDTIYGGWGSDKLAGFANDDTLYGQDGNDSLYGGSGNDVMKGDAGSNYLDYSGNGGISTTSPNISTTPSGSTSTSGSSGSTGSTSTGTSGTISLSGGVLKIQGASGVSNSLSAMVSGSNILAKANGTSRSYAGSSVSKIELYGSTKNDLIVVDSRLPDHAYVKAYEGDDTIRTGAGMDTVYAGDGNDFISTDDRVDRVYGEAGNDTIYGGTQSDHLDGGSGTNKIVQDGTAPSTTPPPTTNPIGSTPPPTTTPSTNPPSTSTGGSISLSGGVLKILGASGVSNSLSAMVSGSNILAKVNGTSRSYASGSVSKIELYGSTKDDTITVDPRLPDHAYVKASDGNDIIRTGAGMDTVYAGNGNDFVATYDRVDRVYGEAGNDTIYGGTQSDHLDGGSGTNKIVQDGTAPSTAPAPGTSTPTPTPTPTEPPSTGGSVPGYVDPNAATPTAVITAVDTSINAGQAVHVHGLASSLRTGNPTTSRYHWNFGDSGSRYNTMVGYNAAHVYDDSGTYTVTLTVTNAGGKVDTATVKVNVASANRKKIYVSASGSDSNDGSSTSRPVRSVSRAVSLVRDNTEILFRRGDTYDVTRPMEIRGSNILIGAHGSGDRPELKWTGSMPSNWEEVIDTYGVQGVTIQDLTLNTRFGGSDKVHVAGIRAGGTGIAIRRTEFLNLDDAINANGRPKGLIVQDNVAPLTTGLRGGFIWADGTDITIVGNSVANSTRENAVRIAANNVSSTSTPPERILVADNNITNLDRSNVDRYDYLKGTIVVQKSKYVYVTGNTVKDGWITIGPLGNGDGMPDKGGRTHYVVVEGNKVNDTSIRIHHGAEHTMVRNNVVDDDGGQGFFVEAYNSTYNRIARNVTLVNNTVINNSDRGNFIEIGGNVDGLSLVNNLFVAPNLVVGANHSAPVYVNSSNINMFDQVTNNVWGKPRILGYAEGGINYVWPSWSNPAGYKTASEWAAYGAVGTDHFSNVPVSSSTFAPSTSSVAASAGKRFAGVFTDFHGRSRPGSGGWTAGAVEV